MVLGRPYRHEDGSTPTLRRRLPTRQGEVRVDVVGLLGRQGEFCFAGYCLPPV